MPDTPPWLLDDTAAYSAARDASAARVAQRLLAGDVDAAHATRLAAGSLDGFNRPAVDTFTAGLRGSSPSGGGPDE